MELAHLVHAMKPWVVFVLGGVLLFALKRMVVDEDAPPSPLVVSVPPGASPADVERLTDEAILVDFAIRSGFVTADASVRRRLVANVRFAFGEIGEEVALKKALALRMHHTDPIARSRLLWLARKRIQGAHSKTSDEALEAYLRAHPERFQRPPLVAFEQEPLAPRTTPLPTEVKGMTHARVAARFGRAFADAIAGAAVGEWIGPVRSTVGTHRVRVTDRRAGSLPTLDEVRERVRFEHDHDASSPRLAESLVRLRAAYAIVIEERS